MVITYQLTKNIIVNPTIFIKIENVNTQFIWFLYDIINTL